MLAALRANRAAIEPYLPTFSQELLGALAVGASNQRSILTERLRRQLAELQAGTAIEIFSDDSAPVVTPELEGQHAA